MQENVLIVAYMSSSMEAQLQEPAKCMRTKSSVACAFSSCYHKPSINQQKEVYCWCAYAAANAARQPEHFLDTVMSMSEQLAKQAPHAAKRTEVQ